MDASYRGPAETAEFNSQYAERKDRRSLLQLLLLGILGGAFIAMASQGSNVAAHNIASIGLAKALAGALFSTGLMMVVFTGAELFTGNMLMVIPLFERKLKLVRVLRNWGLVYAGNFIGSVLVVAFILLSGQLDFSGGQLGGFTIKLAAHKTGLSFSAAFFMGILCNWLVCLAVWMAGAARDAAGKLLAIFFPIWLFIASGFEHSIANMYYIPAGILAKSNPLYLAQATSLGVATSALDGLNWGTFITHNLIPVTLGNMVGGAVFVGMFFWLALLRKDKVR